MKQITNNILMIRPIVFRGNEQTAVNNYYQQGSQEEDRNIIQEKAVAEFNGFARSLEQIGVQVRVIDDTVEPNTPDALFPNNWISFHETGEICLYPMFAKNRRDERRQDIIQQLQQEDLLIKNIIDYTHYAKEGKFLEGTGSMVLDRKNSIAYCALSARSHEEVLLKFCADFNYQPVMFNAKQTVNGKREPIYHTNVMMSVAEQFVIICLDSIDNKAEQDRVIAHLEQTGKKVIALSQEQLTQFAGNVLQVQGTGDKSYLVMSDQASRSLTHTQKYVIEEYSPIISVDLSTIEYYGGGSARCMLAEIFLPKRN